jgi:hypothetical protein
MRPYDILRWPKCTVAEDATYCWHDVIKNKILSLADPFLQSWLEEPDSAQKFEAALEQVFAGLEGLSPARAALNLAPIAGMDEDARNTLLARLDEVFRRDFDLSGIQERLRAVIHPLRKAVQECRSTRDGSKRAECLLILRAAAVAARRELEALPAGFWLPRYTREAKRA